MASLPTGTVTLLFTDIEGSTRLLRAFGDRYPKLLDDHRRLLQSAFLEGHGHVIRTQGDALFVVFPGARSALAAAVSAQRAMRDYCWPAGIAVRVRMGLHSGEPISTDTGYEGMDVHQAARIGDAGHGGQILLSEATYVLVKDDLPQGVALRDLGMYSLKDIAYPQHLFQVVGADLTVDFPPLRTQEVRPNNLPRQLTSFVGREREMVRVKDLLSSTCLLTLTGSGGCGKTRLALQLAGSVVEEYPDGVWLVELAALSEPALVPQTVARTLRIREDPGRPLLSTLLDQLRSRKLLLVLDNCEHLGTECAKLAETLLRYCPSITILATSREPLRIVGETTCRVPSLSFPERLSTPPVNDFMEYEAIRLFVERAAAVQASFALTPQNAAAVAAVCRHLDGIPLAIELAAARAQMLSAEQIAARLDDRFRLLTRSSRTVPPRHQTLRAAMDWSYGLLSESEQTLFRRFAAFAGGWTLEAAEAVCAGDGIQSDQVLDVLSRLIDKSLVIFEQRGKVTRYRQLETVRQYAHDLLSATEEMQAVRDRHQRWFLDMAERAAAALKEADQGIWLNRLDAEHDNLRAVLERAMESGQHDIGLGLAVALWRFWLARGYAEEGRRWLDALLLGSGAAPAALRAKALNAVGNIAMTGQNDYAAARMYLEESLAIRRAVGDAEGVAQALLNLGIVASGQGDHVTARELFRESRGLCQELGDRWSVALALNNEGHAAFRQGDLAAARSLLQQSQAAFRELGDKARLAMALGGLGRVAVREGEYATGRAFLSESLAIRRELSDKPGIPVSLEAFAAFAAARGHAKCAVHLLGAASALRDAIRHFRDPPHSADYDRTAAVARAQLGEAQFAAALAEGRAMTLDQVVSEVVEN